MTTSPSRVLDFGKINPFGRTVGQIRNLLWPVKVYRITLPTSSEGRRTGLNAFETVVIEALTVTAGLDDMKLSDVVCLPVDLVRHILYRLKDDELVTADNVVVRESRRDGGLSAPTDRYSSALVFCEMVSGRFLPFVHELNTDNSIVSSPIGPGWKMAGGWEADGLGPPSPAEVLALVKKFRRRRRQHGGDIGFPQLNQIRVNPMAENYFLDCPIAFRAFDADFRIADPFGMGFSDIFEQIFADQLNSVDQLRQWMANWKENLSSSAVPRQTGTEGTAKFITDENNKLFPALMSALTPSRGRTHRSVLDIYAAIEWAMYYCCEMYDPSPAIRSVARQSATAFAAWTGQIASDLGFQPPRAGLRKPTTGKLDNYFQGLPEMETVCALILVQADGLPAHPLRQIADKHPDLFARLDSLRNSRGSYGHGKSFGALDDLEMNSDKLMRSIVSTLLPTVRFGEDDPPSTDSDHRALMILRARMSVLEAIEYRRFNALRQAAQVALIAGEVVWVERADGDDARTYVAHLYAALQAVIRGSLDQLALASVEDSNFGHVARLRASHAGLGALPDELLLVKPWRIREAVVGNDPTLGAVTMLLLLAAPDDVLSDLASVDTKFLQTISEIIRLRGHANQVIHVGGAELGKLRNACLSTIKALLDLTQ